MKSNRSIRISLASLALCGLATAAFATNYDQVTQALNPVAWWSFDEAGGTTLAQTTPASVHDVLQYTDAVTSTGNKHDVAGISGQGVLLGRTGQAGTDQYLQMPSPTGGAINTFRPGVSVGGGDGSFTVEFWANSPGYGNFTIGPQSVPGLNFVFEFTNTKAWVGLKPTLDNAKDLFPVNEPTAWAINQWNFFVFTFTQDVGFDTGTARLYVNGQPDGTLAITSGVAPTDRAAWNNMLVEARNLEATGLPTLFDELAVFNYALNQNQILDQLYAIPEPGMLSLLALGGAFMVWRRRVAAKRA